MEIKYFGQFLLERNIISREQLLSAIQAQDHNNLSVGEFAVKAQMITREELDRILQYQIVNNATFFSAASQLGIISSEKLESLFARQNSNNRLLGEVLIEQNVMSKDDVEHHFKNFRAEQSILEFKILNAISAHEHSATIDTIIQSTINLFRYLLDMQPRIGGFAIDAKFPDSYDYVFFQKLYGAIEFIVQIYLPNDLICLISSSLLRREVTEISELSLDSAKEFLNIIVGYICTSLSLKNMVCETDVPGLAAVNDIKQVSKQLRVPFLLPKGMAEIRILFNEESFMKTK